MIDFKDDITDSEPSGGDLVSLNRVIAQTLGPRLFKPGDLGDSWESPTRLTGKIMALMSGGSSGALTCSFAPGYSNRARLAYLRTEGTVPSIGGNASGLVVAAFQDEGDDRSDDFGSFSETSYWTGRYENGRVAWGAYGIADRGTLPAVAVGGAGWIALVVRAETTAQEADVYGLRLLRSTASGHLDFVSSAAVLPFASGSAKVRFISDNVVEIFAGGRRRTATILGPNGGLSLSPITQSAAPAIDNTRVTVGSAEVRVFGTSGVLYYSAPSVAQGRIRLDQLLFVENQCPDRGTELERQAFYGFHADKYSFVAEGLQKSKIVRAWDFAPTHTPQYLGSPPTFPGTNFPKQSWYEGFQQSACLRRFGANSFGLCDSMRRGGSQ